MTIHLRFFRYLLVLALFLSFAPRIIAETSDFVARLAPLPVDFRSARTITGGGDLRAQLDGSQLIVNGQFEGLSAAATSAHLHQGPLAIPGPAIADLQVTHATAGKISGTVQLSPEQLEHLHNRALYIQIHSAAAPDGNLRGWLFASPVQ
ncbi:MAG: CHRD domain-containing protein [Cellvibrionaceae bacterium]